MNMDKEFQSLFFWKWGFKKVDEVSVKLEQLCFNPCFFGSGVLSSRWRHCSISRVQVSILVFLEVGF